MEVEFSDNGELSLLDRAKDERLLCGNVSDTGGRSQGTLDRARKLWRPSDEEIKN